VRGGVPVRLDDSPGYAGPHLEPAGPVRGRAGVPVSGDLARVRVPADALGALLAATVDWGDGTSSPATVAGSGSVRTVTGGHTYARPGRYWVTVRLADPVDGATLARTSTSVQVR
jgi:hypothetical protein